MKLKIQLESVMLCRFFKFNYNTLQFNRVEKAQINNSLYKDTVCTAIFYCMVLEVFALCYSQRVPFVSKCPLNY